MCVTPLKSDTPALWHRMQWFPDFQEIFVKMNCNACHRRVLYCNSAVTEGFPQNNIGCFVFFQLPTSPPMEKLAEQLKTSLKICYLNSARHSLFCFPESLNKTLRFVFPFQTASCCKLWAIPRSSEPTVIQGSGSACWVIGHRGPMERHIIRASRTTSSAA